MLPLELEELLAVMQQIAQLESSANWQDANWRQALAAAAEEVKRVGKKLAQSNKELSNSATLLTAGEEAQRAGDHYLDALKAYQAEVARWPGLSIKAKLSLNWVALLAQGALLRQALEAEEKEQRLMKQAALN